MPTLEQDVLRLDVPVYDAQRVRVAQGVCDLFGDLQRVIEGKSLLAVHAIAERLALDERHRVVQQAVRLATVMQAQDARMGKRRRDLDLAERPVAADRGASSGFRTLRATSRFNLESWAT
jgi:hypothetical protein